MAGQCLLAGFAALGIATSAHAVPPLAPPTAPPHDPLQRCALALDLAGAEEGTITRLRELLAGGADPNATGPTGGNAFSMIAEGAARVFVEGTPAEKDEALSMFLELGAKTRDVSSGDHRSTPIYALFAHGGGASAAEYRTRAMRYLLSRNVISTDGGRLVWA